LDADILYCTNKLDYFADFFCGLEKNSK